MKYDVWKVIEGPLSLGATGHEIAIALGGIHLLNSVTPRLAPLRREGLIKDSGMRRERQIVWVTT